MEFLPPMHGTYSLLEYNLDCERQYTTPKSLEKDLQSSALKQTSHLVFRRTHSAQVVSPNNTRH